jgi:GTP-binding protein
MTTPDPLVIRRLEFLGGMAAPGGWRPPLSLPEIAFAGRSNVGKSSLLNRLVRRKAFARVSNTPGRTREINFFQVNEQFVLADLPGYGYARVSKAQRETWRPLIEGYLRYTASLAGVVQLVDVRHDPTADDRRMLEFLGDIEAPTIVVVTKIDKLKPRELDARIGAICEMLGLEVEQVVPFSAVTGVGRDELAEALVSLLSAPHWRAFTPAAPSVEGTPA